MQGNIFRLFTDLSRATDGGVPELQFDYVYFPQEITDNICEVLGISELRCKDCGHEINQRNLRAIVNENGERFAICKDLKCTWKHVWERRDD